MSACVVGKFRFEVVCVTGTSFFVTEVSIGLQATAIAGVPMLRRFEHNLRCRICNLPQAKVNHRVIPTVHDG